MQPRPASVPDTVKRALFRCGTCHAAAGGPEDNDAIFAALKKKSAAEVRSTLRKMQEKGRGQRIASFSFSDEEIESIRAFVVPPGEKEDPPPEKKKDEAEEKLPPPKEKEKEKEKEKPPPPSGGISPIGAHAAELLKSPFFPAAVKKCLACHEKQTSGPATEALRDEKKFLPVLAGMNDDALKGMMARGFFSVRQAHDLGEFVKRARADREVAGVGPAPKRRPPCYLTEAEQDRRMAAMPKLDGASSLLAARLVAAKGAGAMLFYGRDEVPRTWQDGTMDERGGTVVSEPSLLSPEHPVNSHMMGEMGYHSDGAREFPWEHTAGLDTGPGADAEKFILPPPMGPIAVQSWKDRKSHPDHFGHENNENGPQMTWEFTVGTTFGETLRIEDPETHEKLPFEVRLRTMTDAGWRMDVLRPFADSDELAAGIRALCAGTAAPPGCEKLGAALDSLDKPTAPVLDRTHFINATSMKTKRDPLTLSLTADEATEKKAQVQWLPDLPADVVRALLKRTPFKSVFGRPWIAAGSGKPAGWAPSSKSTFNIVPKNYFAAFIPTTQEGCTRCHDSAGRSVRHFDPRRDQMWASAPGDAIRARTWYNFIPGEHRILSWHPWSPAAVKGKAKAFPSAILGCLTEKGYVKVTQEKRPPPPPRS